MVMHSTLLLLLTAPLAAQPPLELTDAVQRAWRQQPGLQAGEALVQRAQAEARALRDLNLPTVTAQAGWQRTDEPMMAFGMKLNQARIAQMDFMPERLNKPDAIQGLGGSLALSQPLYTGGRLSAARRAGEAMAAAEAATQTHRRQQVAQAVVQAYFGSQVAAQGVSFAEDTLRQAQETERFVKARVEQGLMLPSEGQRAAAFRAQAQAGLAEARQRLASARSGLDLLIGGDLGEASLATPLEAEGKTAPESAPRADLAAASHQVDAARAGVQAARGTLLPEVGLTATLGTARHTFGQGGTWTSAGVGLSWKLFSAPDRARVQAAQAQARAAELGLKWQEAQASREVAEARRAVATAAERLAAAQEAVEASLSVRQMRTARHREGLLPLVEVLDAESALSGARTLLLASRLDARLAQVQLALATGAPIEGVK